MIEEARRTRGDVLLTVRVPKERVLLSDFDAWHSPLTRFPHVASKPGESFAEWETRFELAHNDWDSRVAPWRNTPNAEGPHDLRTELEHSWQGIFNLNSTWVQATVHELSLGHVVRAVRIL